MRKKFNCERSYSVPAAATCCSHALLVERENRSGELRVDGDDVDLNHNPPQQQPNTQSLKPKHRIPARPTQYNVENQLPRVDQFLFFSRCPRISATKA